MNKLNGVIREVKASDSMSIIKVDVDGDAFSAIILEGKNMPANYKAKDSVSVLFKETEVGLAKNLSGMISLRNRFKALVTKVDKGPILSRVVLNYKNNKLESVISTQSCEEMQVAVKDVVEFLVKTNEVTLMKNP